jgi:opacity protein-like surface antigen
MMTRHWLKVARVTSLVLMLAAVTTTASAQVVQVTRADARHSIGFNLGYFWVKGGDCPISPASCDSRVTDDTLVKNLFNDDPEFDLLFDMGDFNGFTFGGEWLYAINNYIESGVGLSYYRNTVPSIYKNLVNDNGSEIRQDLRLQMLPITATVRFLPVGRSGPVEPYVGGGVAFINWKYSEVGEFVDSFNGDIFRASYKADGTAVGPVLLGGVRFPIGDALTAGAELRWQHADGDTNSVESQLLGSKIDLGGTTFNFTMHIRF